MWQEGITRNLSWLGADRVGNLERRYFESRPGRLGKVGCIRFVSSENQCKGSIDQSKKMMKSSSHSQMEQQNCQGDCEFRVPTLDRTHRWRWSPCRFVVDPRWLHLSSSLWTSSSTLRAEGRNTLYSTEINWCYKVCSYWSGRHARNVVTKTGMSIGATFCWILGEETQSSPYWKEKSPKGYMWFGERLPEFQTTTRPDHVWLEVWSTIGKAAQNREKQEWENQKPKLYHCSRTESNVVLLIQTVEQFQKSSNMKGEKSEWPMTPAMPWKKQTMREGDCKVENWWWQKSKNNVWIA